MKNKGLTQFHHEKLMIMIMAMQQEPIYWRVPTICKAYFSGLCVLCKGRSPQNMALYGTVPTF